MHLRLLAAGLLGLAITAPAQDLYVFGDSLGDNGNLFALIGQPGAPYWDGRHSDGPVYAEQLAVALRRTLKDYAVGGATTTDVLTKQVLPVVTASQGQLPADGLYVYWAGAMDLLGLLANPNANPNVVIGNAMGNTANALAALILAGAKDIVVLHLPDLSKTPRVLALNDPLATAGAEALAAAYKQALTFTVGQVEAMFNLDITMVDIFALTRALVADPERYMLKIVDQPRIRANGKLWPRPRRFMFFDDIHPTFGGHRTLMWEVMHAIGKPIPGDVNADFVVNISDLTQLHLFYGPCGPCPADLTGDGQVDSRDRKVLLNMLAQH